MKKSAPKEQVNNPTHYHGAAGLDAITVIELFGLGFCLDLSREIANRTRDADAKK